MGIPRFSRPRLWNGGQRPPLSPESRRLEEPPRISRCAPRSAGTHRPAASCFPSAVVGEVCVRVSTGNGVVARQPVPQARCAPGSPEGDWEGAPRGSKQPLPPGGADCSGNPSARSRPRRPLAGPAHWVWGTWAATCWHPGRQETQVSRRPWQAPSLRGI